jgi:acetamidase/formamidase
LTENVSKLKIIMVILKSFKKKIFLVKSGDWECAVNASDAEDAASKAVEQAMACFQEAGLEDFNMGFLISCQEIEEDLEKITYVNSSTILANNGHYDLAKELE